MEALLNSSGRIQATRRLVRELLAYLFASGVALIADVATLLCLVHIAGWDYLPSSMVAFLVGALVAYVLSVRFVFRSHRLRRGALELSCFIALGVVGLLVNSMTLFLAVSTAGLGLFAAKLVSAGCTFATNYALRRHFLFAVRGLGA